MDDAWHSRFDGLGRLLGDAALPKLAAAHVCVIGIGGVGSWTVESLARSGIGRLTLVDLDDVCVHNTNRQLHALTGAIGQPKVEVMAERVRAISPRCDVRPVAEFVSASTVEALLSPGFDLVIDCIDAVNDKCALIAWCYQRGQPLVTVGGVGGRRDPSAFVTADLNRTERDPLLRTVRKRLRQRFEMPRGRRPWGIPCVASTEQPAAADPSCAVSGRLDCETGYGTASYVSGVAGLMAAGAAVRCIIERP